MRLTERVDDISSDSWGDQALYNSQLTGNWDVYAISVNGGAPRNLTSSPSQDVGGTFSPDGQYVAFISNRDGSWAIWVMAAGGGQLRKLAAVPEGFGSDWANERLAWGP
jgi:Tol biopolymer transport system component